MRRFIGADGVKIRLLVAVLMCPKRKKQGLYPRFIRFLPPHLIPRSPFSCAGLLELLEAMPDGIRIGVDDACAALGCIDPRTARKHIRYVRQAVQLKLGFLARILSGSQGTPFVIPEANSMLRLLAFWAALLETVTGLFGSIVSISAAPLLWLTPSFSGLSVSTGRAFVPPETRDTS